MAEPKKNAFGGVVLDEEGRVLLRRVAGNYKGYVWTFPKGRPDEGEKPHQTALREVREETGYECRVLGPIGAPIEGLETRTLFYLMAPIKDHGDFHEETTEVRWFSFSDAADALSLTEHEVGRVRDNAVLDAVCRLYDRTVLKGNPR